MIRLNNTILNLDRAIEKGNIDKVNSILNDININDEPDLSLEDLITKCESEENSMKKRVSSKVLILAASIAVIAAVSVGAATILKQYNFSHNDNYVTVTSNGDLSKDEAKELADDALADNTLPNDNNVVKPDNFKNITEAEKKYDMQVILPKKMPELNLSEVQGSQMYIDSNNMESTIWATYGDVNKKAFGMTVVKYDYKDNDVTSTLKTDAQSSGESFTSDYGYIFDELKESDESSERTAQIYSTTVGNYNYSMVFMGFDNREIKDIVNSTNLDDYK